MFFLTRDAGDTLALIENRLVNDRALARNDQIGFHSTRIIHARAFERESARFFCTNCA